MTKPIPIYDATAPIACTIGDHEIEGRVALIERLRAAHTARQRTERGLLLTFPKTTEVEADVQLFAVEEKRCCAFWGFDVTTDADTIVLRWDGPPDASDIVDRLDAYLAGGGELDVALAGLL